MTVVHKNRNVSKIDRDLSLSRDRWHLDIIERKRWKKHRLYKEL